MISLTYNEDEESESYEEESTDENGTVIVHTRTKTKKIPWTKIESFNGGELNLYGGKIILGSTN